MSVDVFVVGGGPAGLAAAIACARKGMSVALADGQGPSIDKACGEGLLPDSLDAAEAIGIQIPADIGHEFKGIRFLCGESQVEARFRGRSGLGVRRTKLHALLVEHAERSGVHLLWGQPVTDIVREEVVIREGSVRTRCVVGADGGQSSVRLWSGMHEGMWESVRYGFRRHYRVEPWTDLVEVYWGHTGEEAGALQIYVTPVAPDEVGVAVVSEYSDLRLDAALEYFTELRERLGDAEPASTERGGITAMRSLPVVTQGSVALVGDASGSVDAVTGLGVGLAFQQAAALADALAVDDPSMYQQAHRKIRRMPAIMARGLLLLGRMPRLGIDLLAQRPGAFEKLLAIHGG